jgi:hypothetical protein
MQDQAHQPSPIIFPVALQPAEIDTVEEVPIATQPWGWIEWYMLAQVFWGVLLFMPGSQAYRVYIRAFPYTMSLAAVLACQRSSGTDSAVPGARWLLAALVLLICNLVRPETWLTAGVAQLFFQLSIAAPVFWAARVWINEDRLLRLMWLVFAANMASATIGLLQVYYPETFLPPEFSTLAMQLNPDFLSGLTYLGADDRLIIRPPGLSDLPGGAAIAGTTGALLAFGFGVRPHQRYISRLVYFGCAFVGITVVYLTQVRSMLVMIVGCMLAIAALRLRQGRVVQSGWVAAFAGALIVGAFLWAVSVGGEVVYDRFFGIAETGVVQTFRDNRGFFLDYTLEEVFWQYPFGGGLGRWGMMAVYFGEPNNWQFPGLHVEIQPTGWLYDGGVLMWLFYGGAIVSAVYYSYRTAVVHTGVLSDCAAMVLAVQLLIAGLCFTGPVFNTQFGIMFWLSTAVLAGCERTLVMEEWYAQQQAAEAEDIAAVQDHAYPGDQA